MIVSLQPGFFGLLLDSKIFQTIIYNYMSTYVNYHLEIHLGLGFPLSIHGHPASASASAASAAGSASASASCGRWRRWKQKLGELWGKRWLIVGCYGLLWFILVYCVFFMFSYNSLWVHCS